MSLFVYRACGFALSVSAAIVLSQAASASTLKTLHAFCAEKNCADGADPVAGLVSDAAGNLYGTTAAGGQRGAGAIYRLTPTGGGKYKFAVLYSFCAVKNCADGSAPRSTLILDTAGNLYGTSQSGGKRNSGTVFRFSGDGKKTKLRTLYDFCSANACADGAAPQAGLTYAGASSDVSYDGISPLYGTATQGGAQQSGVVFQLTPSKKDLWQETAIYNFCTYGFGCTDGTQVYAGLTMDGAGNLYGTTYAGGDNGDGVVFELAPDAQRQNWTQTVLHSFGALPNGADGENPIGALTIDATGALYGTTIGGGASCAGNFGCGAAFRLTPNGTQSSLSVLYNFCSQQNCADGAAPQAAMAMDSGGTLYGTTFQGGAKGEAAGTVFRLNGALQTVQNFCSRKNCADGAGPVAGIFLDGSGDLFGTTSAGGGKPGAGTVFEITP